MHDESCGVQVERDGRAEAGRDAHRRAAGRWVDRRVDGRQAGVEQLSDDVHFFFSSRRRHTRLQGDWSSDVCSSDLHSGERLEYYDQATGERYVPHVVEPAAGATRTMAAFLLAAYDEDTIGGEARTDRKSVV